MHSPHCAWCFAHSPAFLICACSWPGILCCSTAQQLQHLLADLQPDGGAGTVSCENDADVLGLFLSEAGLQGMLPDEILQLSGLRMLMLGCNPGLTGSWPASLQLPQLQILDVQVCCPGPPVLQQL